MLVSTFELLVKRQFPKPDDLPVQVPDELKVKIGKLSRTVIQGYFLTISNINDFELTLSLVFTIVSNPPVDKFKEELVAFFDVQDKNLIVPPIEPDIIPNKVRYTRTIEANETGLFLLQPNILEPKLLNDEEFEVRGYVEAYVSSLSKRYKSAKLLLTPEHRGTFYKDLNAEGAAVQLDQIAYSLPTSHGGSLFDLRAEF